MKRLTVLLLCVAMLVCATACFKSEEGKETSAVATGFATTAPAAAVTTAPSGASAPATTTTAPAAEGSLDKFPCVGYATDSLNVRQDPSTDKDAIGGLDKGDRVTIVGREGDFYKIEWNSFDGNFEGEYAYVSAQYISASVDGDTPAVTTAIGSTPTAAKTTVPTKPIVQAGN